VKNVKNNFGNGNSASYTKADPDNNLSDLAGTANGPLLASNLGTLNLSGGKKYKLLLTGADVPLINEGEAMPLYYNGNVIPKYAKNSLNYSVVYRFNDAGFTFTRAINNAMI